MVISFFVCIALLVLGYWLYGAVVERILGAEFDRPTPAMVHPDGVDYMPMSAGKAFLIQLLNIAGLGPIFGALSGAIWGPCVYLWIVLGTIFAGGVHDFLGGMLSVRNDGASIAEVVGIYLGKIIKNVVRVFSVFLLVMLGVVFMLGPAGLLDILTPAWMDIDFWAIVVLLYYFLATLLPIDKIIGRLYPIFGVCFIIMALTISGATIANIDTRPMMEISLQNLHPQGLPIWPLMFVTVACGAVSGFHATQSPLIARCLKNERHGRRVFYGAMVAEGVIALIWASAGVAFYAGTGGLLAAGGGISATVHDISIGLLGPVGGVLAIIGVIVCPITSGDTAFRSARLTIADWFNIDQRSIKNRLLLSIPLLYAGFEFSLIDYQMVWRYTAWSNQTLAMIVLWAGAVYLAQYAKAARPLSSLLAALPATFMSAICCTYILYAEEGLRLSAEIAYPLGLAFAVICLGVFVLRSLLPALRNQAEIPVSRV